MIKATLQPGDSVRQRKDPWCYCTMSWRQRRDLQRITDAYANRAALPKPPWYATPEGRVKHQRDKDRADPRYQAGLESDRAIVNAAGADNHVWPGSKSWAEMHPFKPGTPRP